MNIRSKGVEVDSISPDSISPDSISPDSISPDSISPHSSMSSLVSDSESLHEEVNNL